MLLDLVLLFVLLGGLFVGLKKGMAKLLSSLVGFVLAIILAYLFSKTLANFLYKDAGWGPKINKSVTKNIKAYVKNSEESINKEYMVKIDPFLSSHEKDILNINGPQTPSTIKALSEKITRYILKGLAFVIILVLASICSALLGTVLDGIFSLPILNAFNKLGGGAISILLTILKIWIVLGIISTFAPMGVLDSIVKIINKSTYVKLLYQNNLLMLLVVKRYLN